VERIAICSCFGKIIDPLVYGRSLAHLKGLPWAAEIEIVYLLWFGHHHMAIKKAIRVLTHAPDDWGTHCNVGDKVSIARVRLTGLCR